MRSHHRSPIELDSNLGLGISAITSIVIIIFSLVVLSGCISFHEAQPAPEPPPAKPQLRLTTEEILVSDDGSRILVSFPKGVDEPVVFFDDEGTGQWVVSAKVLKR